MGHALKINVDGAYRSMQVRAAEARTLSQYKFAKEVNSGLALGMIAHDGTSHAAICRFSLNVHHSNDVGLDPLCHV